MRTANTGTWVRPPSLSTQLPQPKQYFCPHTADPSRALKVCISDCPLKALFQREIHRPLPCAVTKNLRENWNKTAKIALQSTATFRNWILSNQSLFPLQKWRPCQNCWDSASPTSPPPCHLLGSSSALTLWGFPVDLTGAPWPCSMRVQGCAPSSVMAAISVLRRLDLTCVSLSISST